MYLSVVFYLAIYVFMKTFRLNYLKPLIFPFALLIFALSLLPENLMSAISLETGFYRNVAWVVTFGVTIILLVIARLVRRNKDKKKGGQAS